MTSPASSGPAGSLFEGQTGGSYLLSLLLDVDARGLPGSRIHQIQFQRADESNPLDDVIIKAYDKAGDGATLEVQVKRSITFAPKDPIFLKVTGQIKKASDEPGFWGRNHQLAIAIARTTERIEKSYQNVLRPPFLSSVRSGPLPADGVNIGTRSATTEPVGNR
jgi:hypothetical protein